MRFAQLVDLARGRIHFAELSLDLAHASAQEPLATPGVPVVRFGGQRPLGFGNRHLAFEVRARLLEPRRDVGFREQRDLLFHGDRECRGDEVGEQAGARQVRDEGLPFFWHVVAQVDHALRELDHVAPGDVAFRGGRALIDERFDLDAQRARFIGSHHRAHARADHAHHDRMLPALAARAHRLDDAGDAADGMEVLDLRRLGGRIALGGDQQEAAFAGLLERRQGARPADRQRGRHARKHHGVAHREYGQDARDVEMLLAEVVGRRKQERGLFVGQGILRAKAMSAAS